MKKLTAADCVACGACCQGWHGVEVTSKEEEAINAKARRQKKLLPVIADDTDAFLTMRLEGYKQRCVCLKGVIGKRVRCSVYDVRPQTCRDFQPGNLECRRSRRAAGIEPATKAVTGEPQAIASDVVTDQL